MRVWPLAAASLVLGGAVWYFAIIGVLSIANASGEPQQVVTEPRLLPGGDVAGADIAGLPRYPGSERYEYRRVPFSTVMYTEVEYLVSAALPDVLAHYDSVISGQGWTLVDLSHHLGEWTYEIQRETQTATIEIERLGESIEIEIEIEEAGSSRGRTTDR